MPISRVAVVSGALVLAAAMTVLPVESAGAQASSTYVTIPSNNATVSGTSQVLDAAASSGVIQVQYEITGGTLTDSVIATATPTIYGWIALWNTTGVVNGTYSLQSVATSNGVSGTSAPVTITVNNPTPSTEVVIPSNNATVSGSSQVLDAAASSGVTQVIYEISGGPYDFVDTPISGSTPTIYGWIGESNTGGLPNGTYTLNSVASYGSGASGTSPPITITVNNPVTLADLDQSNISGTGTAALNVNGCSEDLEVDMSYPGGSSVALIDLHITGCLTSESFSGSFTISTTNAGTLSGTALGSVAIITPTPPGPMCPTPSSCQPPYVQLTLTLTVTAGTGPFAGTTGSLQVILTSPTNSSPTDIPFTGSVAAS